MTRYRSFRRASPPNTATPIIAFLLIACFGLLFVTGCSSTVESPEKTADDTFTAEDVARFQQLTSEQSSAPAMSGAVLSNAPAEQAQTSAPAATYTVDPALKKTYDAYRMASSGGAANTYRVTNTFLNVRAEPSVSAASVGRLDQGDLVTLIEFANATWAKITMQNGTQGFVSAQYISKLTTESKLKDEQKAFEGVYFVNFAFVNVRSSPNTGGDKIGEIPGQAFVRPLSVEKDWARVSFEGKDGYVSTQYLSPFLPNFLVRQDTYTLPILQYAVQEEGTLLALIPHVTALKKNGVNVLTFRDLLRTVQTQEARDVRLPPKSVILGITGLTPQNIKPVTDALLAAKIPATLFVQTSHVGMSGISEQTLLNLQANGFDIQSGGHTGDDLRTLTNPQTDLELGQSRAMLEEITHQSVFAVAYPQGGANERVMQQAATAGYLFGVSGSPDKSFSREQFLRLPSYAITSGMTAEDVLRLAQ
jgi:uncharacterized protein YgiM (DUF1202 family)